jgi:hypothetical protein
MRYLCLHIPSPRRFRTKWPHFLVKGKLSRQQKPTDCIHESIVWLETTAGDAFVAVRAHGLE